VAKPPQLPEQFLADIKGCASANRVTVTSHAQRRMRQRQITAEDIIQTIRTATSAHWREEDFTWRVTGTDLDGQQTDVGIAGESPHFRVTTVF
jgi:hypothetical protein